MNTNDHERAAQWQTAAEHAEKSAAPPGNPEVDAYRLVIRAVRQAQMPAMPGDFSTRVASRVALSADRAGFEDGMVTLLLLGMALGGGGYFLPRVWPALSFLPISLPHLSWNLLLAAAAGLALAWGIDRLWKIPTTVMPR